MTLRADSLDSVPDPSAPLVLAVGAFDGVHIGHRRVIACATALARELGARAGVLRFFPHPSRVLRPDQAPPLICTEEQIHALLGVDLHLRLPFTRELAAQPPEAFLRMLAAALPGLRGVVTGPNWRFGRAGAGDNALLRAFAPSVGWRVMTAPDTLWGGALVSSTRIRQALLEGRMDDATAMLGRSYALTGVVAAGKRLGRHLGFPTANVPPEQTPLCPPGVYAMRVRLEGAVYKAAGYVTHHPALVEVHLLDFAGDLYGRRLEVELIDFRRHPATVQDLDHLRALIAADVEGVRAYLEEIRA